MSVAVNDYARDEEALRAEFETSDESRAMFGYEMCSLQPHPMNIVDAFQWRRFKPEGLANFLHSIALSEKFNLIFEHEFSWQCFMDILDYTESKDIDWGKRGEIGWGDIERIAQIYSRKYISGREKNTCSRDSFDTKEITLIFWEAGERRKIDFLNVALLDNALRQGYTDCIFRVDGRF